MRISFNFIPAVAAVLMLACGIVIGADEVELPEITEIVREFVPQDAVGGLAVLVVRDGEVIHKKGYGLKNGRDSVTPDTKMGLASVTKQFAAMCAALLIEEGKLGLNDKVTTHLPDLNFPNEGRELLVKDLLWHTSGLANFIESKEKDSIAQYKKDRALPNLNNRTHAEWLAEQPLRRLPGTAWEYTNSGYVLLARIIEVISGQSFHDFQKERIFDKLGMSDTSDSKRFNGSGNMQTTLNDYIKWERALREGTLLNHESAKLLFQPGMLDSGEKVDYGFGWKLLHDSEGKLIEVFHGGVGSAPASSRNFILRDLRNDITVAFFGRENRGLTRELRPQLASAIRDGALQKSSAERFQAILMGMLESMKVSKYQAKTDIDEVEGRFNCDCSGFIGYGLRQKFPEHYLALRGDLAPWKSRPLAATFYESFDRAGEEGDGLWRKISRMEDAHPGDLLAWCKPELRKGTSTGHVCMILSTRLESDGRFRVRVLDSTDRARMNDTRIDGSNGIGSGEMLFEVDEEGRPVAFTSRVDGKRVASNSILMGRLQSGKASETVTNSADSDLIGLGAVEAADLVRMRGLKWRIIAQGETALSITLSRRDPMRVNAVIEGGKVIRVRRG